MVQVNQEHYADEVLVFAMGVGSPFGKTSERPPKRYRLLPKKDFFP